MKIIHCADLHLDSKMQTHFSKEILNERKEECLTTFAKLIEYAKENEVQVVIFAGDVFDSKKVNAKTKLFFLESIANCDIDFIYLCGNHDEEMFLTEIENLPQNLKIIDKDWNYFKYDNVTIAAINLNNTNFLTAPNTLDLEQTKINIVVLHGQIVASKPKNCEEINLKNYSDKNIDYLALGHLHNFATGELNKLRGVYCYSGALVGRGFDELNEKGFVLLETDKKTINYKFVPFAKRLFREINVDISDLNLYGQIINKIARELVDENPKNLIKINIYGKVDFESEYNKDLILAEFSSRFYFVKVNDRDLRYHIEKVGNDEFGLKNEFAKLVKESSLNEKEKEAIISFGYKAMNGEGDL